MNYTFKYFIFLYLTLKKISLAMPSIDKFLNPPMINPRHNSKLFDVVRVEIKETSTS